MTTNLLAVVLTVLSTNTIEHWPQKWVQEEPQRLHRWDDPGAVWESKGDMMTQVWGIYVPDTNADTKSIETIIKCERWLSFNFEGHPFREDISLNRYGGTNGVDNNLVSYFRVDYRRVRTNVWFDLDMKFHRGTNGDWPTATYLQDCLNGAIQVHDWMGPHPSVLKSTNWFEPVRTNRIAD